MTLLEQLETALRGHDWFYDYSDDYSVYAKGRDQRFLINDLYRRARAEGFEATAQELMAKYKPATL